MSIKCIEVGTHFNHPREITRDALDAMRRLQSEGIQLYNQTVLLKGINDDASTLHKLFRMLRKENVQLHYLSHAMMVYKTAHFRTTVRKGLEILDELRSSGEFRGQLPYYEISPPSGKQMVTGFSKIFFEDFKIADGERIPIIRFLNQITGLWDEYRDGSVD